MTPLFADGFLDLSDGRIWVIGFGLAVVVMGIVFLFVFLSFLNLWIQCVLTGRGRQHLGAPVDEVA